MPAEVSGTRLESDMATKWSTLSWRRKEARGGRLWEVSRRWTMQEGIQESRM